NIPDAAYNPRPLASMSERLFTPRFMALWLFQFLTFFGVFQLLPVIPLRITDLGGSKAVAGLFLTAYTISSALAAPIMGMIADHFGRRRMLVIASILFIVFSLAYGFVPWFPLLLVMIAPASRRTEGLAYWGLAPTMAMAIAPAVGLWIYYELGWLAVCVELAVISAVTSVWSSRLPVDEKRAESRAIPKMNQWWDWRVIATTLSLATVAFGHGGITSYMTIFSQEKGIKPESIFFTAFALSTIFVRIFFSRIADRVSTRAFLYPAFALLPMALAMLAITQTRWQLVTAAILFGAGMGGSFPAFMTFVVAHSDATSRARTFGSVIWAFDTGIGIGSAFTGLIGQRWGLSTAWGIWAGVSCLAIPIFAVTSRALTRGTDVAETAGHAGT
ncbi:MAG TPA: MFS transporter, partial [Thermoanaerobaculia bacterium]|nr:MFS transporter [Thermoanaerobaculia bacterium]